MARVNIEINEEKKQRWHEAAEEHPEANGNLSGFIRGAVEKQIAVGDDPGNDLQTTEIHRILGEMREEMKENHTETTDRLDAVENRLRSVENQVVQDPEIDKLTGKVFDILPDERPGTLTWKKQARDYQHQMQYEGDDSCVQSWTGTVEGLAEALDESEYRVRKAIERLMRNTHLIREMKYNGETRYYRRDDR